MALASPELQLVLDYFVTGQLAINNPTQKMRGVRALRRHHCHLQRQAYLGPSYLPRKTYALTHWVFAVL